MGTDTQTTKHCSCCRRFKPVDEFRLVHRGARRNTWCKKCEGKRRWAIQKDPSLTRDFKAGRRPNVDRWKRIAPTIDHTKPHTQAELARAFGVCRGRIYQIERDAIRKLREALCNDRDLIEMFGEVA